MFEQDYLIRAIEQFGRALARILANKREEAYEQALNEIREAARALTGMDPTQIVLLPVDGILDMMRAGDGQIDPERTAAAARLLKEHGDVLDRMSRPGSKPFYVKAFCLYDEVSKTADLTGMVDHEQTMTWLMSKL